MRVELTYNRDDCSGYGTIRRAIHRGLVGVGAEVELIQRPSFLDDLDYVPKAPRLVRLARGRQLWVNPDGSLAPHGTRYRRWVNNRDWISAIANRAADPRTRVGLRLCVSVPNYALWSGAGRRVIYTMWESTQAPPLWEPALRGADLILVPAQNSAEALGDLAGLVPVRVVPPGLDGAAWPVLDRRRRYYPGGSDSYTFLMVGDLSPRKGMDVAIAAHWRAFRGDPRVRLVLKVRGMSSLAVPASIPHDPRGADWAEHRERLGIPAGRHWWHMAWQDRVRPGGSLRVLRGDWRRSSILELYHRVDCLLWPTRGEGWGYPPREAAATGLPVLTCAHSGQADAAEWAARLLPYEHDPDPARGYPARFRTWGTCGTLWDPTVDGVAEAMTWAYEHRLEAAERGLVAAGVVRRRTLEDFGRDLLEVLATARPGAGRRIGDDQDRDDRAAALDGGRGPRPQPRLHILPGSGGRGD